MTKGEKRIIGQLLIDHGEFVSVGNLHLILGYSRAFVERTALRLYHDPPKGFRLIRMHDSEKDEWFYRIERTWNRETTSKS